MQAAEEVLPVDGLYVPAGHAVQKAWPAVLYVPAAHVIHAAEESLLVDGLYFPAGQRMQELLPVDGL